MKKIPILRVSVLIFMGFGVGFYFMKNPASQSLREGLQVLVPASKFEKLPPQGDAEIATMLAEFVEFFPNSTGEDRIKRARDLNDAYFRAQSGDLRKNISETLSIFLKSESTPEVARALALSHSRLYFNEQTLPNLKDSYDRGVLSFDDYYGELAHIFPGAPADVREGIVNEIATSHNRYAVDIVASTLNGAENLSLSDGEKTDLQKFLKTNEPIFSGAADSFGQFEAIRYEQWLLASAKLAQSTGTTSTEAYVAEKLLDPKTDPRALVALATSPYANSLTSAQRNTVQWEVIESKAQDFIRKNPDNASLQHSGQQIAGGR